MSQPEQNKAYVDQPLFAAKPSFIDSKAKVGFAFGIAGAPTTLPPTASVRDQAYLASLRRIDQAEAVRLVVERLKAKAKLATRDPFEARLLFLELNSWRPRSGDILSEPAVQAAMSAALAALTTAQAPPARPEPVDTIATLKTQMAAMAARLSALESERP